MLCFLSLLSCPRYSLAHKNDLIHQTKKPPSKEAAHRSEQNLCRGACFPEGKHANGSSGPSRVSDTTPGGWPGVGAFEVGSMLMQEHGPTRRLCQRRPCRG